MNETQAAWLAGILEGEGYMGAVKHTTRRPGRPDSVIDLAVLRVMMTDEDIIQACRDITGYGGVYHHARKNGHKTIHTWQPSSRPEIIEILEQTIPHMRGARRIAEATRCMEVARKSWEKNPRRKSYRFRDQ